MYYTNLTIFSACYLSDLLLYNTIWKSSPAGLVPEFEIWRLKVITDLISWIFHEQNWRCGMNQSSSAKGCTEIWCFWPLTASTTSEVKNDYAHVSTQGICNKFIEVNFSMECMYGSQPNRLLHRQLPCLLLIRFNRIELKYVLMAGL